jgi:hypothetical protein
MVRCTVDKRRTKVMETGNAPSAGPQDTRQAAPSTGEGAHLIEDLGLLAGGSTLDGPLGLLAVEQERLAADRHLTTAEEAGA